MMSEIRKIQSFTVDHRIMEPGLYISMTDGDITTYDLRTRKPNTGDVMDNATMHTFEHLFATYVRNSPMASSVVYFGPMGCQTGFYLLMRGKDGKLPDNTRVLETIRLVLGQILNHQGDVFGKSDIECGNYRNLDLALGQKEAARYLEVLDRRPVTFAYPTKEDL